MPFPLSKLAHLIDASALQSLMLDFFDIVRIPMAIIDVEGNVLVGVGWQDICTKFHRVHPDTCAACIESDTQLTTGISRGEFRVYKCKNGMWDVATPIVVRDRHVGNVFSGQFFFHDETIDCEQFRRQAARYGFDEAEYMAALDRVPRLTRGAVDGVLAFFVKLAQMVSRLGDANLALARALEERDDLIGSLRHSERDLARAQSVARTGSWRLDVRRDVLTWSDEVHRMFGVPLSTPVTYESFLSRIHPDDRTFVDRAWQAALAGEPYDVDHRIVVGDEVRWVRERAELEFDNSGVLLGGFGTVQDITERKHLEADLRDNVTGLAEANRLKDEFLSTLSHELRTPLNAILGWTHLLVNGHLQGDAATRALQAIDRNAKVQLKLVNDVLDVARVVNGKLRLDVREVNLASCLNAALDTVRPAAEARQISLTCSVDAVSPLVGDPERLQQVLWNLLSNAVKFTPPRGTVAVTAGQVDGQIEIRVTDTGIGIDPGFVPHLFERFRQADGSISRRHSGLGLGLAIVRHLVELHGGEVSAESDGPGRGATFVVHLPLAKQISGQFDLVVQ